MTKRFLHTLRFAGLLPPGTTTRTVLLVFPNDGTKTERRTMAAVRDTLSFELAEGEPVEISHRLDCGKATDSISIVGGDSRASIVNRTITVFTSDMTQISGTVNSTQIEAEQGVLSMPTVAGPEVIPEVVAQRVAQPVKSAVGFDSELEDVTKTQGE